MKRYIILALSFIGLLLVMIYFSEGKPLSSDEDRMVLIPGGEFIMGSDSQEDGKPGYDYGVDEEPRHKVYLKPFYIDKYEVAIGEYRGFLKATGREWFGDSDIPEGYLPELSYNLPDIDPYPANYISWHDADDYCRWKGKRLPTEAEWEKAARGTDGRLYPWGNEFDFNKANVSTSQSFETDTKYVKSYENGKSPYGVLNMTGNVWEWTLDWYKPYPGSKYESEYFGETFKVFRGNGYSGLAHLQPNEYKRIIKEFSKVTFRFYSAPSGKFHDVGCRCVKEGK